MQLAMLHSLHPFTPSIHPSICTIISHPFHFPPFHSLHPFTPSIHPSIHFTPFTIHPLWPVGILARILALSYPSTILHHGEILGQVHKIGYEDPVQGEMQGDRPWVPQIIRRQEVVEEVPQGEQVLSSIAQQTLPSQDSMFRWTHPRRGPRSAPSGVRRASITGQRIQQLVSRPLAACFRSSTFSWEASAYPVLLVHAASGLQLISSFKLLLQVRYKITYNCTLLCICPSMFSFSRIHQIHQKLHSPKLRSKHYSLYALQENGSYIKLDELIG